MKLWIARGVDWEDYELIGVFSSVEKAEAALAARRKESYPLGQYGWQEVTVDERVKGSGDL